MAALRAEPKFDLIWADPPYKDGMAHATRLLQELQTLARPGACFILESDKSLEQPIQALTAEMSVWQLVKQRAYGNTMIHRFEFGTANSCGDDHD